jgi:hypothetical protein
MKMVEMFQWVMGRRGAVRRSQKSIADDVELEQQYRSSLRRLRDATEDIRRSSGTVIDKLNESEELLHEAVRGKP